MLTRNWLHALRSTFSHRQTKDRARKNKLRASGFERLEDRTLLYAPYSQDDTYSAVSGETLTVGTSTGVLSNDMDMEGDPLTAQLVSPPSIGTLTLNANGSFSYAAPSAYSGSTSFTYRAFDGTETGNTATVTIGIGYGSGSGSGSGSGGGTNSAPVAVVDNFFVEQNSAGAQLPVLWNDAGGLSDQCYGVC